MIVAPCVSYCSDWQRLQRSVWPAVSTLKQARLPAGGGRPAGVLDTMIAGDREPPALSELHRASFAALQC